MARTRTIAQLVADVRYRADVEGLTARHPDANIGRLINESWQALREELSDEGFTGYLKKDSQTTMAVGPIVGGTTFGSIPAPADCVRVYGVDVQINGLWTALEPIPFEARNDSQIAANSTGQPYGFLVYSVGTESTTLANQGTIGIFPAPDAAYVYQIWYLPAWVDIDIASNPTYAFNGVAGWEEFVIWDVAVKIAARDDDMRNTFAIATQERGIVLDRIKSAANRLQRVGPGRRQDVRGKRVARQGQR